MDTFAIFFMSFSMLAATTLMTFCMVKILGENQALGTDDDE